MNKAIAASFVLLSSTTAMAQSTGADQPTDDWHEKKTAGFLADVKGGGFIPFNGLTPGYTVGIDVGVLLPVWHRGLAIAVGLDYASAWSSGNATDPRLLTNGGAYSWNLQQEYLTLMPQIMYRYTRLKALTIFVGVGPRIYFMRSTVNGVNGGSTIDTTTEVSTQVGFGVPLGAEIKLGPGGILAELLPQWGPFTHTATGDTHTGAIGLSLGYRLTI